MDHSLGVLVTVFHALLDTNGAARSYGLLFQIDPNARLRHYGSHSRIIFRLTGSSLEFFKAKGTDVCGRMWNRMLFVASRTWRVPS